MMNDDEKTYSAPDNEFFLLWVLIAQSRDAILRARERDYARYGISNERRAILFALHDCGGQSTPTEIARRLFREVHSVSEMLVRMEKDGLVTKQKATGSNKVIVKLAAKGLDVFEQSLHSKTDERIFSALSEEERKTLSSLLMRVRSSALEELRASEWQYELPAKLRTAEKE
ncbi:MAG: MarR family transcriptional regulator [Clostridiales bacterium]|nr:MarR family transcriptional regulator [Clostridiales bacterium]